MPVRNASAVWEGGLKGGKGTFKAGTGAFGGNYSFGTRFEEAPGTNPEELIASAHAACFSMALSAGLERAGKTPARVETKASATFEKVGDAFDQAFKEPHEDGNRRQRFACSAFGGGGVERR